MNAVPKGQLYAKIQQMLSDLLNKGVIVLPEGEIENYSPQTGGHGPSWVRAVIETDAVERAAKDKIADYFRTAV
jgi:hypothetical protein